MSNLQTGWDFDTPNQGSDNKKAEFAKFPEGVTYIRVLDDAPVARWTHWYKKHNRSVNCPGKGCPICDIRRKQKANGETYTFNMQKKLSMNIINRATERVEILDQGATFFEDLRTLMLDLKEKHEKELKRNPDAKLKSLKDFEIKVRRTGKDDNTTYRLDLDEEYPMTEADLKLAESDRVDFEQYFKPHTVEQITRLLNGEEWAEVMKSEASSNDAQDSSSDEEIEVK